MKRSVTSIQVNIMIMIALSGCIGSVFYSIDIILARGIYIIYTLVHCGYKNHRTTHTPGNMEPDNEIHSSRILFIDQPLVLHILLV